jgi:hypothetical protein
VPLAAPRTGESLGFSTYPEGSLQSTLGDPEDVIWSSIKHLCSRSAAEWYALHAHGVTGKGARAAVARNLKLYVQQASEFYNAAAGAKPNTAPLIYYYSFLNLAKALCELRNPRFHRRPECYTHGLSWRPDPKRTVDFPKERVTIRGRGVWHVLWESVMRRPCPTANQIQLPVKKLFSYCPEVSAEYLSLFGGPIPSVDIKEPTLLYDGTAREVWLRFSVDREELRNLGVTAPKLVAQMQTTRSGYMEVKSGSKETRTFESQTAKYLGRDESPAAALHSDILGLGLIVNFGRQRKLEYSFPLQSSLPLRLPQLVVSYTILFWMGSLVRYDPHSLYNLMDSPFWILIDGFMSQSRIWLLELFEWAFYQTETTLGAAR